MLDPEMYLLYEQIIFIILASLLFLVYWLLGLFALISLSDFILEKLSREVMPDFAIGSILVWAFWPVVFVYWGWQLARKSHSARSI